MSMLQQTSILFTCLLSSYVAQTNIPDRNILDPYPYLNGGPNLGMLEACPGETVTFIDPLASKASKEVANFIKEKSTHTPIN